MKQTTTTQNEGAEMNRTITKEEREKMEILGDDGNGSQFISLNGNCYDLTDGVLSDDVSDWDNR